MAVEQVEAPVTVTVERGVEVALMGGRVAYLVAVVVVSAVVDSGAVMMAVVAAGRWRHTVRKTNHV